MAYQGRGEGGKGWGGGGKRDIIYLLLHCHYQSFSCIKVGSDESHFNVSVGSDGQKSQDSVHKPQPFLKRKESQNSPRSFRLPA